jgi:hypothetical protein
MDFSEWAQENAKKCTFEKATSLASLARGYGQGL